MSRSTAGLALLACLTALGTAAAGADLADAAEKAPVCENRSGDVTPGERVAACTAILKIGGLTAAQESMTRVNRAWAYSLQGKMADARSDYDHAVELNPRSHVPYNERGLFHLRNGQLDDAVADYNTALSLTPNAAFSLYGRGLAYIRKGDTERGDHDLALARRADGAVDSVFRKIGMAPEALPSARRQGQIP